MRVRKLSHWIGRVAAVAFFAAAATVGGASAASVADNEAGVDGTATVATSPGDDGTSPDDTTWN
jgi:hypothetical protein